LQKNKTMANFKFFIIPRARTGGTLLATMLNAHPRVTMGYEIYPHLLLDSSDTPFLPSILIQRLTAAKTTQNEQWVKSLENDNFRVFASRARRSGLEPQILIDVIAKFEKEGQNLESLGGRLDLIDALLERQAIDANKPFVGGKMRVEPEMLFVRHPEAVYLMMLRDGRDVLDSRLKVGDFKATPESCAREWSEDIIGFEDFLKKTGARGCLVPYEKLVNNPEKVLFSIMEMAGLEFHPQMVDFTNANQPLFNSSHGHLSANQLSEGLSAASIGRWKNGLSSKQLKEFMSVASGLMIRFGYAL
jgi:hypothetical protein